MESIHEKSVSMYLSHGHHIISREKRGGKKMTIEEKEEEFKPSDWEDMMQSVCPKVEKSLRRLVKKWNPLITLDKKAEDDLVTYELTISKSLMGFRNQKPKREKTQKKLRKEMKKQLKELEDEADA
jgi:hypothetical protein